MERGVAPISPREAEVLRALGEHLTNAQIAARLFLSVRTVENHVSSLLRKLGAADRRELAALAGAHARVRSALPAALAGPDRGGFVGRVVELEQLRSVEGQGLVLVTGEPGIGKTRFAVEAARAAYDGGATVLFGRCDEEQVLPLQPFAEALRHLVRTSSADALAAVTGVWAADLARLLPELTERLPDLAGPIAAAPDTERFRLFEGIASTLSGCAPLLLVIDDLQWADETTILLLRHLLRSSPPAPIRVLATCREGEVDDAHPLRAALADLQRDELVTRIRLGSLSVADVAQLIGKRQDDARRVHRLTAGNPFFVRQLVRHLDETGVDLGSAGVPAAISDVVRRRLARLDADAQQALIAASVIGRAFRVEVVAKALGRSEAEVLAVLEQAAAASLFAELGSGEFAFIHDLVRHAVYGQLGATRRARLHRWVADALEAVDPGANAELARHYKLADAAEVADKAVEYALRAAATATAQLGYEDAARCCEAALPVAHTDERRARLLLALGEARAKAGDRQAGQAFLDAAAAARAVGDPALLADAALGLTATWGPTGIADPTRAGLLEEAIDAIGPGDSATRAKLLAKLAGEAYLGANPGRRDALSAEAVAIARRVGDPATLASCLDARTYVSWGLGGAEQRLAGAREICRLAMRVGDRELALSGHAWGITATMTLGDLAGLDAELAAYSAIADELRQPRHRWYALSRQSVRAAIIGEFDGALRLAADGWRIAVAAGEPDARNVYIGNRLMIWLERPPPDCLTELDAWFADWRAMQPVDAELLAGVRSYVALMHAALGDELTARRLAAEDPTDSLHRLISSPEAANTLLTTAWTAVHLGDRERMAAVIELLAPHHGYCGVDAGAVAFLGSIHHTLGMLATSLQRWRDAAAHLDAALDVHRRMGARPWIARTYYEQARLALALGHGDAETRLAAAAGLAAEIGMPTLIRDIRGLRARTT